MRNLFGFLSAAFRRAFLPRRSSSRASLRFLSVCAAFPAFCLTAFCGCAKNTSDLFSRVSELRDNVLIAESDADGEHDYHLCVYSYLREQPLISDGATGKAERVAEFYFTAKDGSDTYVLRYVLPGTEKEGGGELSYDDVKRQYYLICSEDLSDVASLDATVTNEKTKKEISFHATGAKNDKTLSPREILSVFESAENEKISSLTTNGVFRGEIRMRLIISEEKPYYYVGIIDEKGSTFSYLLNGETGKILARRESDDT
ncbi:MAG: hypothetical protein SPH68_06705 [Candidatus Borkfalkiaceae bacterium]|nr:hypothetical protein [Clostridia bacterium]MDY6223828.1 hypothetical protein [Christensenellaceae bacterium]